jgi:hypothetical protein
MSLPDGKGTTKHRGYGYRHKKRRQTWARVVRAGNAVCARCHEPILPNELWDLDHHDDDRRLYLGPSHSRCNRATSQRNKKRALHKPKRFSASGENRVQATRISVL